MKKDVIYIDIEDDITAIIDKIERTSTRVVALVPPKRVGVLQSIVNLKLLEKSAERADKRLVLITNDQSLKSLAASLNMPVARNLQSKPEIPRHVNLTIDDDDVIDGNSLPVGEIASIDSSDDNELSRGIEAAISGVSLDENKPDETKETNKKPSSPKVPNFSKFRKWLFISGGFVVLLVSFMVWATIWAPNAEIQIQAHTNPVNVSEQLKITPDGEADITGLILKPTKQEKVQSQSIDFDATGTKEVGEKAKGTITLTNSSNLVAVSVPAGTAFVANGMTFYNDAAITVPAPTVCQINGGIGACPGTASGSITAAEIGEEYNLAAQAFTTSKPVSAKTSSPTTGGSKKTVTVVSEQDIAKAKEQLASSDNGEALKELTARFDKQYVVLKETFSATPSEPTVSPAVGTESARANIKAETTYRLYAVKKDDIDKILQASIKKQISDSSQRIYKTGIDDFSLEQFSVVDGGFSVKLQSTGQIGPNIDEAELARESVGKRAGEIQQELVSIDGIQDVKVNLSPFWVSNAPSADKIRIEFVIETKDN